MELAVGRPDKRKRDIDNVNKAVLDLLEAIEVVENDHYIHDLRSYWSDEVSGVQVMIKDYEESKQSRLLTN
jgi:Holliday junction resolvase RusA-like endonuclease